MRSYYDSLYMGSLTSSIAYDGIDVGGERVAQEIEEKLQELAHDGHDIKKLSMVGYSLGGLIARYAIGLLHSKGWFEKIEPVNFTTFATPHLGVRTPLVGYQSYLWNSLGARTLSTSGRQLFLIDSFRDTGKPLLSVLADSDSVFVQALSKFKNRSLYSNIINDRSAPFYTTFISSVDPFDDLESINIRYLKDYAPTILDGVNPVTPKEEDHLPSFYARLAGSSKLFVTRLPLFALLAVVIPIGTVAFLINSGIQSVRSQQRIRLHEEGSAGMGIGSYKIPLMVGNARNVMDGAFENVNAGQHQEYLDGGGSQRRPEDTEKARPTKSHLSTFPTLALAPEQFDMIQNLDDVGFRKFPVHIQMVRHSHAAIIVRKSGKSFQEGKVVARHWLNESFEI